MTDFLIRCTCNKFETKGREISEINVLLNNAQTSMTC